MIKDNIQNILVVEDDKLSQFVIVEMCRELGYRCTMAEDGEACLEVLTSAPHDFNIILMDIHMPKVSGLEASSAIRASETDPPKNLPIVAVTADAHWHNPHRCRAHGFDAVIPKPVTLAALSNVLRAFGN